MQPSLQDRIAKKRQQAAAAKQAAGNARFKDTMLDRLDDVKLATLMQTRKGATDDKFAPVLDKFREILESDEAKAANDKHQEMMQSLNKLVHALDTAHDAQLQQQRDVERAFEAVANAIKQMDVRPEVTMPQPKVIFNEKAIDFKPLQDTIREVMVKDDGYDRFNLNRYRPQDIKELDGKQYIGFMNPEGDWYLMQNDMENNTLRYVFGSGKYSKHFTNASSYDYQLLEKAITDVTA